MKKHKRSVFIGIMVILLGLMLTVLWYISSNALTFTTARCVVTDTGSRMMVVDDNPIVLMPKNGKNELFKDMKTGDKILVLHSGIMETYPEKTFVYYCKKLEDGKETDIDEMVYDRLEELGYFNRKEKEQQMVKDTTLPARIGMAKSNNAMVEDKWGMKFTVEKVSTKGATLVFEQFQEHPKGELQTGAYYSIEQLDGEAWKEADTYAEWTWDDIAYTISQEGITTLEVEWSEFYGELEPGSYRIKKLVQNYEEPGAYEQEEYYAYFDIVDVPSDGEIIYEFDDFILQLPYVDGFEYAIEECVDGAMSWGIDFRPVGEEGWVMYHYWEQFGVCGTGLETTEYKGGTMGTYDNSDIWSYISYPAEEGNYVVMTTNVSSWWNQYNETVMNMIDQVEVLKNE